MVRPLLVIAMLAVNGARTASYAQSEQTPAPAPETPPPGSTPDEPLSRKLDKSEGVLTPPRSIDPKMDKGPPAKTGDKMRVIVPPGEPGGDPSIQPK